ncbi:MAG: zinc-binding dehydrogenase [Pseudoclavibacter sp.]
MALHGVANAEKVSPLSEAAQAHAYGESGRVTGKLVLARGGLGPDRRSTSAPRPRRTPG